MHNKSNKWWIFAGEVYLSLYEWVYLLPVALIWISLSDVRRLKRKLQDDILRTQVDVLSGCNLLKKPHLSVNLH